MLMSLLRVRTLDDFRRPLNDRDRSKLEKSLKGLLIKVIHRGDVKRRFKIVKLTPTPASSTHFTKENSKTDVASYFHETYGRRLLYPFLPCVVTGRDVFLPMEICHVIEVRDGLSGYSHLFALCKLTHCY